MPRHKHLLVIATLLLRRSTIAANARLNASFPSHSFTRKGRAMTDSQLMICDTAITVRPIRPTDVDMEADFIRRLSPQARHYRFLGGVKELSAKDLNKLCDVDGHHSMAFIATIVEDDEEREIGVSRYAPNSTADVREMAVTVADDWQKKGLGTKLVMQLIQYAKAHGVKRLYSIDLADNYAMHELAKDIGMTMSQDPANSHQVIYSLNL